MLRSLRFQLPALFLLGVVVAGLVSAAIALRLFRSYAQDQLALAGVQRAEEGVERPHAAVRPSRRGLKLLVAVGELELATGDRIYYRGLDPLPRTEAGRASGRCRRRRSTSASSGGAGCSLFDFPPPEHKTKLLAVARPLFVGKRVLGDDRGREAGDRARPALARADRAAADRVRGRPRSSRRRSPGTARAGSRSRCSRSRRPPTRSRTGNYDVDVPSGGGGRDRRPRRALPRDGRAARRGRGARAQLPDDGLARAAHAADRDPRPRRRAARGRRHGRRAAGRVADGDRRRGRAARAARRRRARPGQARRAPLHRAARGGRHGAARRPGLRDLRRGGAAARDRLPPRGRGATR